MIRVWLTDLFKALLRVPPQVTGPYRAYQTTRSTGGFDSELKDQFLKNCRMFTMIWYYSSNSSRKVSLELLV